MKRNDIALHIAIGLAVLAIISLFMQIGQGIAVGISAATLLFTIAQTIESRLSYLNDDTETAVDVADKAGLMNMSAENVMMFKALLKYDTSDKKKKSLRLLSTAFNCLAFAILFASFVIPISVSEKVSSAITIASASILFISLWFVEKQRCRKDQWNEVLMLSMLQHSESKCDCTIETAEQASSENEKDICPV